MVVLSRLGVTFKVGFLALTAGALIAACGTITVIDPDGGSGPDGASGGAGGGGQGGSGLSDGGAIGGRNGGGSGGTTAGTGGHLGGSGGTVAGTGGRVGGSGGSGGTGGVFGGSGGVFGGVGGSGGTGGRPLGVGGTTGSGGAGAMGGGTTCSDIRNNFATALAEARTCTTATGCPILTSDQIECGCPTSVSHSDRVDSYRQAWIQNGCSSGACPAIFCVYVSGGVCSASPGSIGMCANTGPSPGAP